ncbi:response regulator, partial [Candidatus Desantisbacteria bacterium]|nr:response regulator [Candidatus Desantisbacteria bacterium]
KVASGEEALKHLLNMEFAVIILDVKMPGMDGFETAKLIRQRQQTRHVPIIFVTAYAQTELDSRRGYELGAVDYLFSPVAPIVLKSKVVVFINLFKITKTVHHQSIDLSEVNQRLSEAHQQMIGICRDLHTSVSQLKEQIRDVEEMYRSIFENVSEGIFQIAQDGSILMANPAMVNMLNYDSCEQLMAAVSNIFQQLFVDPDQGELLCQRVDIAGMVHGFEARIYTKDKDIIWVLLGSNAVHEKGLQVYYECIVVNITERKKLEEKLIKAEKAEAVAELIAKTADGIRNPLQVIQLGLYSLKMTTGEKGENASKTIDHMDNAVWRAAKVIDELIDSSRGKVN